MNTIDQNFFLKNIPEAFQMRKDLNMKKQNKTVEIDIGNNRGRVFSGFNKVGSMQQAAHKQRTKPKEFGLSHTLGGGRTLGKRSNKGFLGNDGNFVRQEGLQNQFGIGPGLILDSEPWRWYERHQQSDPDATTRKH